MGEEQEKTIDKIKSINELNKSFKNVRIFFLYTFPILLVIFLVVESIWSKNFHFGSIDIIIISAFYALYYYLRDLTKKITDIIETLDK